MPVSAAAALAVAGLLALLGGQLLSRGGPERAILGGRVSRSALVAAPLAVDPKVLDDINPGLWPGFPWAELRGLYDAWMPMSYWTLRTGPDRDAGRFTRENLVRLRQHLGDPQAPVHALGGVGEATTEADTRGFVEAARAAGALGASIYDFRSQPVGTLGILGTSVPADGFDDGAALHE